MLGRHLGELELHGLELDERLAELLALLGPFRGVIPGSLREAEHLRADADAAFVEGLDGDLVALAGLAEHLRGGDAQSRKMSSQVLEARMPSLSSFLPRVKPGVPFSTRNAVMPL
jgi:hypothetical protein